MEDSILNNLKPILSVEVDDDSFDNDIITHTNSVFSTLHQIGIGPEAGFMIEDDSATWEEYFGGDTLIDSIQLNAVKTYMYLRVRLLFDPPTTSYHIAALEKQKEELETRLSYLREVALWRLTHPPEAS